MRSVAYGEAIAAQEALEPGLSPRRYQRKLHRIWAKRKKATRAQLVRIKEAARLDRHSRRFSDMARGKRAVRKSVRAGRRLAAYPPQQFVYGVVYPGGPVQRRKDLRVAGLTGYLINK